MIECAQILPLGENMATHPSATIKPRDRFLYAAMAVVATSLVFAGFARTYYLRHLFTNVPLKPLLHLHGFLFTSWLVLLLVQVTLVAAKRTDLHRRLGVAGGVLAALMVVVGPIVAIHSRRPLYARRWKPRKQPHCAEFFTLSAARVPDCATWLHPFTPKPFVCNAKGAVSRLHAFLGASI
jgi:hypothetical protein